MRPRVSIITLNWNGSEDTKACVRSLLAIPYANLEIVVCDNASRPDAWQALIELADELPGQVQIYGSLNEASAPSPGLRSRVVVIQTGANLGYAGGINVGLRYALTDPAMAFAWVLNNDTEVAPTALQALLSRMDSDPSIGICGSTLLLYHDRQRVQVLAGARYQAWRARSAALGIGLQLDQVPRQPTEIESQLAYVNGAAMFVRRAYLEQVGLMDERYFLYSEEHDWAHRGRAKFRLGWAPSSHVYHRHGATIGTSSSGGSALSLFYLYRSKLAFVRWREPWWLPTAFAMLAWEASKYGIKGQWHKSVAAWRGLLAQARMKPYQP